MKLHCHIASTNSRPLLMFVTGERIDIEAKSVDLFTGEHVGPAFSALNPNRLVPAPEDGDFVLSESSPILKYLAEKVGSLLYPIGLKHGGAGAA